MAIAFTRRAVCTEVISAIQPSKAGPTMSPAPEEDMSQRCYSWDEFLHRTFAVQFVQHAAQAEGHTSSGDTAEISAGELT